MCIQRGLDGVAAEIKRWTAEGVTLPCSEILLGHGTDLPTLGKVCYVTSIFILLVFISLSPADNWTDYYLALLCATSLYVFCSCILQGRFCFIHFVLTKAICCFRDLFNVAFVSCWSELHEELQNELVKHLEMALESQIPEITQTLLNLAEFMEHTEKVRTVPSLTCPRWFWCLLRRPF